jgi:peptide/nickel transport system substrate-binding protein
MNEPTARKSRISTIVLVLAAVGIIVGVALYRQNRQDGPEAASEGDTILTVGFDEAPRTADPRLVGFDANSQYLEELRFLPLFSFDPDGNLLPLVASSIAPTDAKTFVVKIRPNLKFANGAAVGPKDVVATYEHMITPPENFPPSPRKGAFSGVIQVFESAPDEVTFKLAQPDAAFPSNLVIGILPAAAVGVAPDDVDGKGFESGPYGLAHRSDSEWILKRNETFDGTDLGIPRPKMDRVRFLVIRDETTRYAALVRGDLDLIQNALDADRIMMIQRNQKLRLASRSRLSLDYLGMATNKGVFANQQVRQALAYGINRDEILKFTLQQLGTKATGTFPPESRWSTPLRSFDYDPAKAAALLDAAGLVQGPDKPHRFQFDLKVTTSKTRIAVAKAIAAQLERIGVKVRVESLEFGVFMDQLKEGAVAAWLGSWTGFKDPDHLHFAFNSTMAPPSGGNRGHYANAEVDRLTAAGKAETDPDKRKVLYDEAQTIISEDAPYVFLWHPTSIVVTQSNVQGFRMFADGRYLSLPEVTKN